MFTDIRVVEDAAAATEFLVGRMFDAGEMFMIRFSDGVEEPTSMTVSFATREVEGPAPIPVPAAGALMVLALGGLGGLGAMRRRKAA